MGLDHAIHRRMPQPAPEKDPHPWEHLEGTPQLRKNYTLHSWMETHFEGTTHKSPVALNGYDAGLLDEQDIDHLEAFAKEDGQGVDLRETQPFQFLGSIARPHPDWEEKKVLDQRRAIDCKEILELIPHCRQALKRGDEITYWCSW